MEKDYKIKAVPRKFEVIAKQIVDYITTEKMIPGEKIPTERKLSELLDVSRSSIREGLRVLELLNFIDSKQGEGTFVHSPPPFIIPYQLLGKMINKEILFFYVDFSLQVTENIFLIAMNQNIFVDKKKFDSKDFITGFPLLVTYIAENSENPFYLSIWQSIFPLYRDDLVNMDINTFRLVDYIDVVNQKDEGKIKSLLGLLKKSFELYYSNK